MNQDSQSYTEAARLLPWLSKLPIPYYSEEDMIFIPNKSILAKLSADQLISAQIYVKDNNNKYLIRPL